MRISWKTGFWETKAVKEGRQRIRTTKQTSTMGRVMERGKLRMDLKMRFLSKRSGLEAQKKINKRRQQMRKRISSWTRIKMWSWM